VDAQAHCTASNSAVSAEAYDCLALLACHVLVRQHFSLYLSNHACTVEHLTCCSYCCRNKRTELS